MSPDAPDDRSPLRVALAPTAPVVMAGTESLLTAADDAIRVVRLPDTQRGLAAVDLVLYDPVDDIPTVMRSAGSQRRPKLLAFAWSVRSDIAATARSQGAAGLVSKNLPGDRLATALRSVHTAGWTEFVVVAETESLGQRSRRADGLTTRELEVLAMITEGMSNEDIAAKLYLSINSVKTYVRSGYRKIGVTRRPQAVLWGVHNGLGDHVRSGGVGTDSP